MINRIGKTSSIETKNEDILILPEEKGTAAVLMDKEEYNSKLNKKVSDTKVYQKLKSDFTPVFKQKLIAIFTMLKDEKKITKAQYYYTFT